MNYKKSVLIFILACSAMFILVLFYYYNFSVKNLQNVNLILYREATSSPGFYQLNLLNIDSNQERTIGTITGSLAWSPDGHLVAFGCSKEGFHQICIVSADEILNFVSQNVSLNHELSYLNKISLPKECKLDFLVTPTNEIQSISWSPDEKKLVVTCSNAVNESRICILDLSGDGKCWNKFQDGIARVLWIPTQNKILVSYGENLLRASIFMVSLDGEEAVPIATGWSPDISPDGKKIAFFRWDDDAIWENGKWKGPHVFPGIAVTDLITKQEEWLYRAPTSQKLEHLSILPLCGELHSGTCRLGWSPDGQSIVFSAKYADGYIWKIFQLNVLTKEIKSLTDSSAGNFQSEPEWKP